MRFGNFIEQATEPAEKKDGEDPRQKRLKMLKRQVLMKKVQAVRQGGGEDITASYEPDVEDAVEYFYEEGVTEEELDMIIEEVGDDIVDFIDEERKARKMNVRSKGKLKKDVAKIKADKSDVVPKKTSPKDALNRAVSARVFKKKKLKRPESTVTKATKKVKAAPKKAAPKKAAPKATSKPAPKKKASKEGIRGKLTKAYKKGVERHKAAVKKNKFASGVKAGVKAVGKAVKDVHSITQVNKDKTVNMQSYEPEGELVEGLGDVVKKGVKRHKDAVQKKKVKDRKAVPYAALTAGAEYKYDSPINEKRKTKINLKPTTKDTKGDGAFVNKYNPRYLSYTEEVNDPQRPSHAAPCKLFQYKVSLPEVGETIVYANSPAELMIKLRLLVNPRLRTGIKIDRILPYDAYKFYTDKRAKALRRK